ncbi:uncharacterized protein CLUP02_01147 [Colletotrichum lupini]|uniref:Uncharacterized protein n=1 Tax=Colletotrichum lupini TaxID=145971 RepID=A0A9Q8W907_9PEZI|nr:uncharacterized protein CLUP02_01147 [Colletotrichum lupini]UQC74496.1 hypothetical protein CLUP02_01147 [Colletotrichum lupini]
MENISISGYPTPSSLSAKPFRPNFHGQVIRQQTTDQPHMPRGVGGSLMFATSYSAAIVYGSFTGTTPEK